VSIGHYGKVHIYARVTLRRHAPDGSFVLTQSFSVPVLNHKHISSHHIPSNRSVMCYRLYVNESLSHHEPANNVA